LNLRNKDNSTLRRPLVASYVEVANPNNLVEVGGSLDDGKTNPTTNLNSRIPLQLSTKASQLTHHIFALIWQLDLCQCNLDAICAFEVWI
jgi:hypothetical protein